MKIVSRRVSLLCGMVSVIAGLPLGAWADNSEPFELDRQPCYIGPAFRRAALDALAAEPGGLERGAIAEFQFRNALLLSWLPLNQFPGGLTSGATVEGYVSPSGREYAIFGHSGGASYVDVTDPDDARIVATLTGPASLWRDVQFYQQYAYVVSEGGGGVQVIDLSQIDNNIVTQIGSVTTPNTNRTHTIQVNRESGYLYRCGGGNWQSPGRAGLRVYSLANPASPAFVGQWTTRYIHECQVVNWTTGALAGRELAFVYSEDTSSGGNPRLEILDVTDKASITVVGSGSWANGVFSHQGWLSPDRQYVYIDDELDEVNAGQPTLTRIFNVSNPAAPVFVGAFGNGLSSIDHNQYVLGSRLFQSNYRTGLRVWDVTNPIAPAESAWFDTYPDADSQNFNGLWDNDPFLPSGIVLGSDIERGLFVWWVGAPPLDFDYPDGRPEKLRPMGGRLRVRIEPRGAAAVQAGTARLYLDTGEGFEAIPLVDDGGNMFHADLPALACGAAVSWYVAADCRNITFRDPPLAPSTVYSATAATFQADGFADDMEIHRGWVVGGAGDTATQGIWTRVDPVGTTAQPEDDATPGGGTICYVTGNGSLGGAPGAADVDGGSTTLTSPTMNALALPGEPFIAYARWYSNNEGGGVPDDALTVQLSNNNGVSWVTIESVTQTETRWVPKLWRVAAFASPTATMKIRFIASDTGAAGTVEAGVDDVRLVFMRCSTLAGDTNGDCLVDLSDIASVITGWGQPVPAGAEGDANADGVIDLADVAAIIQNWAAVCPN